MDCEMRTPLATFVNLDWGSFSVLLLLLLVVLLFLLPNERGLVTAAHITCMSWGGI